ncbi:hypothetical protein [Marinoscillum furvescens]|uniref:Lipocalin-like protein n=1 Tax=Marinoscillum furvescens DSM 4134 TaxID=1122208 RepID=A0A3D9L2G1_MARFU|nr:hypothetical protein [Marinoscillum furvescens]RED97887.1 hypothetical protein C7460_11128 [Marinoscillum furvescens DSM 4134]
MNELLLGNWSYRSLLNNPDLSVAFNDLQFGKGTIRIDESPVNEFKGLIYGPGWSLDLKGSVNYGSPFELRFQGKGVVGGEEWIYNYVGYMVQPWVDGNNQPPTIVGSIVRVIPHSGGSGQTIHPAGVVASWYAVKQEE